VKVEFWDDEKLATISRDARLLFIGLWTYSDDYGVVKGHPVWLKSKIFPYDNIDLKTFQAWLNDLSDIQSIQPFSRDGENYIYIKNFTKHQVITRPSKLRNPLPDSDGLTEHSLSIHRPLSDEREREREREREVKENNTLSCKPQHEGCASKPSNGKLTQEQLAAFGQFWQAYPKRKNKGQALKAWAKIHPDEQLVATMIAKIRQATTSDDWTKENGRYIPHPATWLNAIGWEDDDIRPQQPYSDKTAKTIANLQQWMQED